MLYRTRYSFLFSVLKKITSSIKEAVTRQNDMFPELLHFLHKSNDKPFLHKQFSPSLNLRLKSKNYKPFSHAFSRSFYG